MQSPSDEFYKSTARLVMSIARFRPMRTAAGHASDASRTTRAYDIPVADACALAEIRTVPNIQLRDGFTTLEHACIGVTIHLGAS
jgi:hypothetical protein